MKLYNNMKALAIDLTDFDVMNSKAYSLAELERYKEEVQLNWIDIKKHLPLQRKQFYLIRDDDICNTMAVILYTLGKIEEAKYCFVLDFS